MPDRLIGRTPRFGRGNPGSSPGPAARSEASTAGRKCSFALFSRLERHNDVSVCAKRKAETTSRGREISASTEIFVTESWSSLIFQ